MADDVDRLAEQIMALVEVGSWCEVTSHERSALVDGIAALLRARLPRWTEVTDDPGTWPPRDELVLFDTHDGGTRSCRVRTPSMDAQIRRAVRDGTSVRWMPWPASPAKEET